MAGINSISGWLLALLVTSTVVVEAKPLGHSLDNRAAACNGDNLLNRFRNTKYSSQAVEFCETFINSVTFQTVTVTVDAASIATTSALALSTVYPSPLLTTSYPASRLSSACSCISLPPVTSVVTAYVPSATSITSSTSSSSVSSLSTSSSTSSTSSSVSSSSSAASSFTSSTSLSASSTSSAAASSSSASSSITSAITTIATSSSDLPTSTSSIYSASSTSSTPSSSSDSSTSVDSFTSSASSTSSAPTTTATADLGCWNEGTSGRALPVQYASDDMTVEKCAILCSSYVFYGVEYGRECYCGNSIENGAFKAESDACDIACVGDTSEICGGRSLLNVYQVGGTTTTSSVSSSATAVTYPYVSQGCYAEPASGARALTQVYSSTKMTKELCFYNCWNGGFKFAGLEYGQECWCGNAVADGTESVDQSYCSFACSGDSTETCGASSYLELYGPPVSSSSTPATVSSTSSSASSSAANTFSASSTSAAPTSSTTPQATCNAFQSTPSGYDFTPHSDADLASWDSYYQPSSTNPAISWVAGDGAQIIQFDFSAYGYISAARYFNLIRGATYTISYTTYSTSASTQGSIQVYGGETYTDNYWMFTTQGTINQWQTTTQTMVAMVEGYSLTWYINYGGSDTARFLVGDISITLVSLPTTSTTTLSSEPVIVGSLTSGESPLPSSGWAQFYESITPTNVTASYDSPGYDGAAYSRKVDFTTTGGYTGTSARYLAYMFNPQLTDYSGQFVGKLRYRSADSSGCYVGITAVGWWQGRKTVSGCDGEWEEMTTVPMTVSSSTQFTLWAQCYHSPQVEAKFWFDDFRLYKVEA